jgi:hypothetical protein
MRKIFYEEEQRLKDNQWLYVCMLTLTMAALLPLIRGMHLQIVQGEPWGNKPMSNEGIIALTVFIFLICGLVTWIMISTKLHVIIDADGVHYRFFPHEPRWCMVSKEEIMDFEVEKKNLFTLFGHHRKWFVKTKTMNVNGNFHLALFLKNGKKLQLGSRNPEGLRWAMKKLLPKNEII